MLQTLAKEISSLQRRPTLAVMLVGSDPASRLYVSLKRKRAAMIGVDTILSEAPEGTPAQQLVTTIERWNNDATIDGILVQLPLPADVVTDTLMRSIDPQKDVDGFHPLTIERVRRRDPSAFVAPVHQAVLRLIKSAPPTLSKNTATIIGNSTTFVEPLRDLLKRHGILTSTIVKLPYNTSTLIPSDIVITALGKPRSLRASMIGQGTIIIDVGTTRMPDGSIVGDVDRKDVTAKAGALSPVPGGVGPLTISYLLSNVVKAAKAHHVCPSKSAS